ncbi:MAG: hypothetical protein SOV38_05040 [Prevotella sp.]|nr:hypothetical protein [Prevotella sp.]
MYGSMGRKSNCLRKTMSQIIMVKVTIPEMQTLVRRDWADE